MLVSTIRNGRTVFVEYARFCGERVEFVAYTESMADAAKFDARRARLLRKFVRR